jgi:hypothetical protein
VIIVLAHQSDQQARRLIARWSGYGAMLLTPAHLSLPGWRLQPGRPSRWSAIVGERRLDEATPLLGVLSRLPRVKADDLDGIIPEDRPYVAAEMTAFLASWLAELRCSVVNPPTPDCLAGPAWRAEEWVTLATRLGIPVSTIRRSTRPPQQVTATAMVTIAGRRCLGMADASATKYARLLASAACVQLGTFRFDASGDEWRFAGADLAAEVDDPGIADALLAYFCEAGPC